MADPNTVLARLRSQQEHRNALAKLLVDAVLDSPAQAIVTPQELINAALTLIQSAAEQPKLIEKLWLQLQERVQAAPAELLARPLGELLPMTLVLPLESFLRQAPSPGRPLLTAVMDHAGMRQLLEEMLHHELSAFSTKIRKLVPDTPNSVPGKRLASKIAGVAKGVAAVVGSEIERQMEDRTRDFVHGALARSTQRLLDRMASPEFAPQLAQWRVDVLHALLALPLAELRQELDKLDQAQTIELLRDTLEALVQWEGLREVLDSVIQEVWPSIKDRHPLDLLTRSEDYDSLQQTLQPPLRRMIARMLAREDFGEWLTALHAEQ